MMDVYVEVMKERYLKPIQALLDGALPKTITAFIVTGVDQFIKSFNEMFSADLMLIQALFVLIIIDWVTGIYTSWQSNRKITSLAMRSTVVKVFEYALFLSAIIILSNLTDMLVWVQTWVFVYMSATEVKSIAENLFDENKQMQDMMRKFWDEFKGKGSPDITDEED